MAQLREERERVRFRSLRTLALAACVLWAAPPVARAATDTRDTRRDNDLATTSRREAAPLALTRAMHWAQLRAAGATVVRDGRLHLQQAPNDCALAIVEQLQTMRNWPRPDRRWLARSLALTPTGVVLDTLAATLRALGWRASVVRAIPHDAAQALPLPAIALMQPGHYVLLTGRTVIGTTTQVEYFDPLVGLVLQPLPAFEARWTGKSVQLSARDN